MSVFLRWWIVMTFDTLNTAEVTEDDNDRIEGHGRNLIERGIE